MKKKMRKIIMCFHIVYLVCDGVSAIYNFEADKGDFKQNKAVLSKKLMEHELILCRKDPTKKS